ncbi:Lanthionine synthetase C-like protein [Thermomonospora echinospora]|uniref:non-specific serine/threonine protein kinase n=1 Tax=Thermomonospora echinospora TaxID=1992 RepID=A0A1H5V1C9_9ACTN|nr:class III lanthionine synthetase LanKC [Thermomonospora echinospora]SEF80488.1 Lanthionine synthetase C-like protein [Thermomonospora echinospora]
MDQRYELYCLTDRFFYDAPKVTKATEFAIACRSLPDGWTQVPGDEWMNYEPPVTRIPPQGWKVHVSGCAESADTILEHTWDYCVPRGIAFKHLRGPGTLRMRNAKYAPRGASGKLVTIYPADEDELARVLDGLGPLVAGLPGPYILSDLRIGDGPLYVRYGGFARRRCTDERGELVPAMENGDGELVPDRRGPVFTVPDWVTPPRCLLPHLAARSATTTTELPYRIEKALHFSNGGGVYAGTDTRTGKEVILKEARPHAGLAADGADAVARLQHERDMLERLAGIDGVPAVLDYFTLGEHHFLVQERIEGRTLNTFFAERHPLLDPELDPGKVAGYTSWALRIHEGVERLIDAVHARGVVYNDLHMFNIMVRPDDSVALIDFEVAAPAVARSRQTLANPAYQAPPDRRGVEVDRYSLACLRLALFLPMTTLFTQDRHKARQLAEVIAEHFPVPQGFLDKAVAEITRDLEPRWTRPRFTPDRPGWEAARTALGDAIRAAATPERPDRLFPGDIAQFAGASLGMAHGAAGVLYALDAVGAGRDAAHEEWLARKAADPPQGTGLGFYDGLLGAAYTLASFGHIDAALTAVSHSLKEKWERLGLDLYGGLPGFALVLDHLADVTSERSLRQTGWRAAELVISRMGDLGRTRPGFLYGGAGIALMFLRLYERTGEASLLAHAATALRHDLASCRRDRNDALQVDDGSKLLPYIDKGSVGIGLVIDEYLALGPDDEAAAEFVEAREGIRLAARALYYAQPSLLRGRAGMVLHLSRQDPADPVVARHVESLAWHAIPYRQGLAFPGDQLYRLSCDLSTGTAGVLLALGAALADTPVDLPFLRARALPPIPGTADRLPVRTATGPTSIQPERG